MKPTITVDARMIHSAGIGTYLQSLLPLILRRRPQYQFCLLGKASDLEAFSWAKLKNARFIPCESPIYGFREQIEIPKKTPSETGLFWSPHYNIPLGCPAKLLVTVHDVFHLAMPQFTGGIHKRLYAWYMFSSLRKMATAILSVSQFSKDELLKYTGPAGCQPQVVYNGVDESWFKVRKKRKPHQRPYFIYVGSVKPHKNLMGLLEAFEKVKDQIPQDLIIVGKKEGFITGDGKVIQRAEKMGNRIVFTGDFHYDDPLFRQYYAWADFLVLPSFYESFGLPALEAMACGVPVLVSSLAAFPEVYGDAALYCDPSNPEDIALKLLKLSKDLKLRKSLVRKGRVRAKRYSWKKSADKILEVIDSVFQIPNPKPVRRV